MPLLERKIELKLMGAKPNLEEGIKLMDELIKKKGLS